MIAANELWRISLEPDPLKVLHALDGYYECPKDEQGKRLGPLVGYAGKDARGSQMVGEVYANFAKFEQYPHLFVSFCKVIQRQLKDARVNVDVFCGAPMGGLAFATALSIVHESRYVFMEKQTTALATGTLREQSRLFFKRHEVFAGERVVITEDVCNNFSTTNLMVRIIEATGARVVAIACLLNRSLTVDDQFTTLTGNKIPVFPIVRKPIHQWRQSDSEVASDIAAGKVILKPKNEWGKLMAAMQSSG
jgi:orotate phosphoribosyltransferase